MEPDINSAIKHGFLQQVRFLIEYGHSINKRDEDQRTPLINCAFVENEIWGAGLGRLFIEKGGNISLRDKLGLNALHYACIYGRLQLVQVYLNALDFNLNAADRYGNTPLHYAAATGHVEVTRALANCCKKYGLNVDKPNKKGETPLALAWKSGHQVCGDLLIQIADADADIEDNEGKSAREWLGEAPLENNNGKTLGHVQNIVIRPRTALGNIQVSALPLRTHSRPTTALSGTKQRPYTAARHSVDSMRRKSSIEKTKENLTVLPEKVRQATGQFYTPASDLDHRNNPQYVFQISPADYFSTRDGNNSTFPLAGFHSARRQLQKKEDPVNSSWRNAVKQYFTSYDYQFAHSYRKPAVAPEPEPEEPLEERSESPVASEMGESDLGSVVSKKGGKGGKDKQEKRKTSQSEKHEKHDLKSVSRKISTLASPSKADVGLILDSSSSESINGKRMDRIKSARPGSRDGNQSRVAMRK